MRLENRADISRELVKDLQPQVLRQTDQEAFDLLAESIDGFGRRTTDVEPDKLEANSQRSVQVHHDVIVEVKERKFPSN